MLTRAQGWVGLVIIFGTLGAVFHGMHQRFLGTGLGATLAALYGVAFVFLMWWILFASGAAVSFGRHPRLFMCTVTFGLFALGFGAAQITPGLVYTRLFGTAGEWPYTVESSTYVGYQKWGPSHCYAIALVEVSWPMANGEICLEAKLRPGTPLVFTGKRSVMGTEFRDFRLAEPETQVPN